MIEEVLIPVVKESPILAGGLAICWMFLRALDRRDAVIKEIATTFADATEKQTKEQKKTHEVIGANSAIIKQCSDTLTRMRSDVT